MKNLLILATILLSFRFTSAQSLMNGSRTTIGYIDNGTVMNSTRTTIGYIDNGTVMNSTRTTIGYYDGIKGSHAALFFFFFFD